MHLPTRTSTRLGTRLSTRYKSLLEEVITEYFRHNEGTTDYILPPNLILTSNITIRFGINAPPQDDNTVVSFRNTNSLNTFGISSGRSVNGSSAKLRVFSNAIPVVDSTTSMDVFDNIFHVVTLEYFIATTSFRVLVDGIEGIPLTDTGYDFSGTDILNLLRDATSGDNLIGIVADVDMYDDALLVRSYAINDNSSIIKDSASGEDATVVNGTSDQWGLFREFPTLWKGINLDVPPWDSEEQELLKE
jgi:hypothetical protein